MPYMDGTLQGFKPPSRAHDVTPRSSGPQTAIIQQDTETKMRRVASNNVPVYTRDGVRKGTVTGGNEITYDPYGTGGGIYNAPRRLVAREIGTPLVMRRGVAPLLGEYDGEYLGFSLGKIVSNIGKTVKKAVVDTGHAVGTVVTSKLGQAALGTALAVTGVGAPAAAAIFAATKGAGTLIKPGGNLKGAVTGAAQGAVEGVISAGAGKLGRAVISKITSSHASGGDVATQAAQAALPATAIAGGAAAMLPGILTATPDPIMPVLTMPPLAMPIPSAPQNDGLFPRVPQPAPMFPKQKRVQAATPPKVNVAKKVLDAGASVKKKTDKTAGQIDAMNQKLDAVNVALEAAKTLGDKTGSDQLSQMAAALQSQLQNAQNVAGGVANDVRQAGNAAYGAAGGAVAGGGLSSLGDFINEHKALVYGGAAATALVIALAVTSGGRRTSSGGYARPRRRRAA